MIGPRPAAAKAVRLASEAAVAGSLGHHGLLQNAVVVSDGAGQFDVFRRRLDAFNFKELGQRSRIAERELINLGITFLIYSEQEAFLHHHPDRAAQMGQVDFADIIVVETAHIFRARKAAHPGRSRSGDAKRGDWRAVAARGALFLGPG
ncbi:hypothetical protein WCLP8_1740006 [uncultured Gammaproteobacteria bacterium]